MIVCSCHAVTDREIRRAVSSGARTPCQVAEMCGAGSSCGGCHESVSELLEAAADDPRAARAATRRAGSDSVSA